MEHHIASYLFQTKSCPLPDIGSLLITERPAIISAGNKRIEPPQHTIALAHGDFATDSFVRYISAVERIEEEEAKARLERFCDQLHNLDSFSEMKIPHIGKFYIDAEGNLIFKQGVYPSIYLDGIAAEKVIHPQTSHALLVGDKESNTTLMTEYFNVEEAAPRQRWWIAALIFALIGLAVISLYYINETDSGLFGNSVKTELRQAPPTYSVPK